ncbi:MAG: nicotinate-nucleotide adenylyltransferase [Candidatus Goldbacteria bacterium]|nr:nicotinate-nucleotide adenylyltransferase [Candidatus Goldiibacteriota bacterium]
MNNKKIGMFGGTFNPPHVGHLLIGRNVMKEFNLNKIIFIPAYIPPHKQTNSVIDAKHRLKMVELMIENEPGFLVSDFEIKKQEVSYTIDTMRYFISDFPDKEFYFIVGSDNFYYIETWKDYKNLLNIMNFIIYLRRNFTKEKILEKHKGIINDRIFWSKSDYIDVSSSEIRTRIKNGENCIEDVGEKVWDYILKNKLYK